MYKKALFLFVSLFVTIGFTVPTFASASEELSTDLETNEYAYIYNNIEIVSNTSLTPEQLKEIYSNAVNQKSNTENQNVQNYNLTDEPKTPMGEDPGSSYVQVIPPKYTTYSNTLEKWAAELLTAYIVSKAPRPVQQSAFGAWTLNKLQGWVDYIEPTHVGAWTSSSYDNYTKQRRYYNTLVHFENSNYTDPLSIQYYDVTNWWVY